MFEVNDAVFDLRYGNGVVKTVGDTLVKAAFGEQNGYYYSNGATRLGGDSNIAMLYHGKPEIIAPAEPVRLKVDDEILVSDYTGRMWMRRYFSHWENGLACCFTGGNTSWSIDCDSNLEADRTCVWTYWRKDCV